jgi:hypothetical protein
MIVSSAYGDKNVKYKPILITDLSFTYNYFQFCMIIVSIPTNPVFLKRKSKTFPVEMSRIHIVQTIGSYRWLLACQSYAPVALCPQKDLLVLICVRSRVNSRAMVRLEG